MSKYNKYPYPTDKKMFVDNINELKYLEEKNQKVGSLYPGMLVIDRSTGKWYIWKEDNNNEGIIEGGFTYPDGYFLDGINLGGKKYNFIEVKFSDGNNNIDFELLYEVRYEELVELINSEKLVPGASYIITDYRTTILYPDEEIEYAPIEEIVVKALTYDTISNVAHSLYYPEHILIYDILGEKEDCCGRILRRIDTVRNIDLPVDFVNYKIKRWNIEAYKYIKLPDKTNRNVLYVVDEAKMLIGNIDNSTVDYIGPLNTLINEFVEIPAITTNLTEKLYDIFIIWHPEERCCYLTHNVGKDSVKFNIFSRIKDGKIINNWENVSNITVNNMENFAFVIVEDYESPYINSIHINSAKNSLFYAFRPDDVVSNITIDTLDNSVIGSYGNTKFGIITDSIIAHSENTVFNNINRSSIGNVQKSTLNTIERSTMQNIINSNFSSLQASIGRASGLQGYFFGTFVIKTDYYYDFRVNLLNYISNAVSDPNIYEQNYDYTYSHRATKTAMTGLDDKLYISYWYNGDIYYLTT